MTLPPSRRALFPHCRVWFRDAQDLGWWSAEDSAARQRFLPMASCSNTRGSSAQSLDFNSGAGVIFLSIVCTAGGLLLNAVIRCSPAARAARRRYARQEAVYKKELMSTKGHRLAMIKDQSKNSPSLASEIKL
jgi:hypothetical protein